MSNRAGTYLRSILSDEQYAEYKRQQQLDSRDSTARQKWRSAKRHKAGEYDKTHATNLAWLRKFGYVDSDGQWTGLTKENP